MADKNGRWVLYFSLVKDLSEIDDKIKKIK